MRIPQTRSRVPKSLNATSLGCDLNFTRCKVRPFAGKDSPQLQSQTPRGEDSAAANAAERQSQFFGLAVVIIVSPATNSSPSVTSSGVTAETGRNTSTWEPNLIMPTR